MTFKEDCDSIGKQTKDGSFLYPNYKEKCISNLPGTILNLFGLKTRRVLPIDFSAETNNVTKVVLFVLDGFGYNQFRHHSKSTKFLTNLSEKADIFPLTSVFPSQTTNALTTLNTGLTPQEHGLFEYYLYRDLLI